jgi:hypothetical protein
MGGATTLCRFRSVFAAWAENSGPNEHAGKISKQNGNSVVANATGIDQDGNLMDDSDAVRYVSQFVNKAAVRGEWTS